MAVLGYEFNVVSSAKLYSQNCNKCGIRSKNAVKLEILLGRSNNVRSQTIVFEIPLRLHSQGSRGE